MNAFHIVNGDAIVGAIREMGMSQPMAVWREAYSLGKTAVNIDSKEGIAHRENFFSLLAPAEGKKYHELFISQLQLIRESEAQEIILWFGADYFCQINLLACLSFLFKTKANTQKVSLICTDNYEGRDILCLGHLHPEELAVLFKKRKKLDHTTVKLGATLWEAYCKDDNTDFLEKLSLGKSPIIHFEKIKDQYLALFPDKESGINIIQKAILSKVASTDGIGFRQLIRAILKEDKVYGFGDLQFEFMIRSLSHYFDKVDDLTPSSILHFNKDEKEGAKPSTPKKANSFFLGGVSTKQFYSTNNYSKLIKAAN